MSALDLEVTPQDWIAFHAKYMMTQPSASLVLAFIQQGGPFCSAPGASANPTPRQWEKVMKAGADEPDLAKSAALMSRAAEAMLSESASSRFSAFAAAYLAPAELARQLTTTGQIDQPAFERGFGLGASANERHFGLQFAFELAAQAAMAQSAAGPDAAAAQRAQDRFNHGLRGLTDDAAAFGEKSRVELAAGLAQAPSLSSVSEKLRSKVGSAPIPAPSNAPKA